jgi:hypothetical protein
MGGGGQTARGRRTVTVQTEGRRTVSTEAARWKWKAQLSSDRGSPTVTSRSVAISGMYAFVVSIHLPMDGIFPESSFSCLYQTRSRCPYSLNLTQDY